MLYDYDFKWIFYTNKFYFQKEGLDNKWNQKILIWLRFPSWFKRPVSDIIYNTAQLNYYVQKINLL